MKVKLTDKGFEFVSSEMTEGQNLDNNVLGTLVDDINSDLMFYEVELPVSWDNFGAPDFSWPLAKDEFEVVCE